MSSKNTIVREFLEQISWRVLEEYRPLIAKMIKGHGGVYALYKNDRLYYVGLASNLMARVNHHLKDRHKGKWDRFSVYLTTDNDHIRPLEALLLRIINPEGNRVRGRLQGAKNLFSPLHRMITEEQKDRTAALFGARTVRQRRRHKTRTAKGTTPLKGLLERRQTLRAKYKGREYRASLRRDGQIQYDGVLYKSPTAAARRIVRRTVNGWSFWNYRAAPRKWVPLSQLKR